MTHSPEITVTLTWNEEDQNVHACVDMGGTKHWTQGRDHAEALLMAGQLAYLVLNICPERRDARSHCYCQEEPSPEAGAPGFTCCQCLAWTSAKHKDEPLPWHVPKGQG